MVTLPRGIGGFNHAAYSVVAEFAHAPERIGERDEVGAEVGGAGGVAQGVGGDSER